MTRAWFRVVTPGGVGGIAVVEVGGPDSPALVAACTGRRPQPGDVLAAAFRGASGGIDQILVVCPAGGATVHATANVLELHCHGGAVVVGEVCARLASLGARPAEAPPLTLAADLQRLLRIAPSRAACALVLEQAEVQLLPFLRRLARARCAAGPEAAALLRGALQRAAAGRAQIEALPVALWGRKNAGKSALLNRLVASERALSGPEPGLTRDAVVEETCLEGYPVRLWDLPGVGRDGDALEAEALRRAGAAWASAALPLLVVDPVQGAPEPAIHTPRRGAWVMTKVDLASPPGTRFPPGRPLALVRGDREDLGPLVRRVVGDALRRWRGLPPAGPAGTPVVLSAWQAQELAGLAAELESGDQARAAARLDRLLAGPAAGAPGGTGFDADVGPCAQ